MQGIVEIDFQESVQKKKKNTLLSFTTSLFMFMFQEHLRFIAAVCLTFTSGIFHSRIKIRLMVLSEETVQLIP